MPGEDIVRVFVNSEDTIFHLHNMFKAHYHLGNRKGSMFILPTTTGLFQMDADLIPETEFISARRTALLTLRQYGFRKRDATMAVIFLPYYQDDTIIPLMASYLHENIDTTGLNFRIPLYSHIHFIPDYVEEDEIQVSDTKSSVTIDLILSI
jgi:hypothetical protein